MCQSQSNINLADFPDATEKDVEDLYPDLGSFNLSAVAKNESAPASLGGHSKGTSSPFMLGAACGFTLFLYTKGIMCLTKRFAEHKSRANSSLQHESNVGPERYRSNLTAEQVDLLLESLRLSRDNQEMDDCLVDVIENHFLIPGEQFNNVRRLKPNDSNFAELDPISTELVPVPVDEMKLPSQVVNRMALLEVRRENAAHVKNPQYPVKEIVSQILQNEKISANDLNLLKLAYVPSKQNDGLSWVHEHASTQEHIGTISSTSAQSVTYDPLGDQASFFKEAAVRRRAVKAELELESRGKGKEICEDEPFQPEQDQGFSMSQSFYNLPAILQTQAAQAQMSRESAGETSSSAQNEPLTEGSSTSSGQKSKPKPKGKKKKNKGHGRRP